MSIEIVPAYNFQEEIRGLLTEYTDMLIEGDSDIKNYLELQNYDEELEDLQQNTACLMDGFTWLIPIKSLPGVLG